MIQNILTSSHFNFYLQDYYIRSDNPREQEYFTKTADNKFVLATETQRGVYWRNVVSPTVEYQFGPESRVALDWSAFETRRARGTAMGSVAVEQYLQTPLKGSKAEYDYLGTAYHSCSRTLLPQYAGSQWNVPCWWLEQHKTQWQ